MVVWSHEDSLCEVRRVRTRILISFTLESILGQVSRFKLTLLTCAIVVYALGDREGTEAES